VNTPERKTATQAEVNPTRRLDGQWALITGAAKRIGACTARTLHEHGANIAVHYGSSDKDAEALVSELNGRRSDSAFALQADLRHTAELTQLVATIIDRTGRLDLLINNASTFTLLR